MGQQPGIPTDLEVSTPSDLVPVAAFQAANEVDEQGNPVVREGGKIWKTLNDPLVPQIALAGRAIANVLDPKDSSSDHVWLARARGMLAGMTEATGQVAASFTSPLGLAMTLAGLGPESSLIKRVPALAQLADLPAVRALQRAVQVTGGTGFTADSGMHTVDAAQRGDVGGIAQGVAGMAAGAAGTYYGARPRPAVGVPGGPQPRMTPEELASNDFARQEQIPLDAATMTNSPVLRGAQKVAANTVGGELASAPFLAQQQAALGQAGERLADAVHPTPVDPVGAGQSVADRLKGIVTQQHANANAAYGALRDIEQQKGQQIAVSGGVQAPPGSARPFTAVPLAVDVKAAKVGLKPLYDALLREKDLAPSTIMGDKARVLLALDKLMEAPDLAPLSTVDSVVSDLKVLTRGAKMPQLRTAGQGSAAAIVSKLDAEIRAAAARGGADVTQALDAGRAATKAKYAAAEVLDLFNDEPRGIYDTLVRQKDRALTKLRALHGLAPDQMPVIGRALLEDMLTRAQEQGKFDHADKLYREWQNLGQAQKALLFDDPALRARLDSFFLLAKRIAMNPNPSGSAHTALIGLQGAAALLHPIDFVVSEAGAYGAAKVMYSQRGAEALNKLLSTYVTKPSAPKLRAAAQAAGWAEVVNAGRAVGVPLTIPAMAQGEDTPTAAAIPGPPSMR